ncbi:MAG: Mur ligase domain-containing protein [Candidatus Saccharimonadales bacterium]
MNIYFSGISGTALAPLAQLAADAGYHVAGSDLASGAAAAELAAKGIEIHYGTQDGKFMQEQFDKNHIDWFVYTSALPANHPELELAKKLGLKTSKRDELLSKIISDQNLKLIAVAGTHGKTTTTSMLIWACHQLQIPISYSVGSTLSWAKSGEFNPSAKYFIYEADEYDRNFLNFHPDISIITTEDYDHADTYPTREDYHAAFEQFRAQSKVVIADTSILPDITLVGELRRYDASLAFHAIKHIYSDDDAQIINALNTFPGAGRRFERLTNNIYTDYAHHPKEISATVKMARELADKSGFKGLAVIYQPHQNIRQHEVKADYKDAFKDADKIFWLPTYLTREDPNLPIIKSQELIATLSNAEKAQAADLDDALATTIKNLSSDNWLILLMTAGTADAWIRQQITR